MLNGSASGGRRRTARRGWPQPHAALHPLEALRSIHGMVFAVASCFPLNDQRQATGGEGSQRSGQPGVPPPSVACPACRKRALLALLAPPDAAIERQDPIRAGLYLDSSPPSTCLSNAVRPDTNTCTTALDRSWMGLGLLDERRQRARELEGSGVV